MRINREFGFTGYISSMENIDPSQFSGLFPAALAGVSCGFLAVRLLRGNWTAHPHITALGIIGAVSAVVIATPETGTFVSLMVTKIVAGLGGGIGAVLLGGLMFPDRTRE